MRRERSFLILVVLGIALGAYIYFVERKRPAADAPEEKPKVFANVQEADIEEIVVATGGETTRLKKTGDRWQITEPFAAPADREAVNNLTGNFASLERNDVVDENPSNVKDFGLDPPRADVGFRTKNSKDMRHLHVGNRTPTGGDLYARVQGEPRVILISGFMDSVFVRSAFDLRDKSILVFDRDKTDAVEIVAGGRRVKLTHAPSEWRLAEPLQVRADFGTAEGIVGRLASAQMKAVVANEGPDAANSKKFGFDKPTLTVTITGGSAQAALKIGGKDDQGNYYATDTSRPLVFTVEPGLVDELNKPAADFRRKDLFDFRPFNATRIELSRGGETLVFEKVKNEDENAPTTEKWRQSLPSARDVDMQKMDAFLSGFSNIRIESWSEKPAPQTPQMALAVKFDAGKKDERVTFARAGNTVHVSRSDEPGTATISATDYETAVRALDDLLAPAPQSTPSK
jgi:hypothetical protein